MNVELIYFPCGSADLSGRRTECALFIATLSDQVWDRRAETVKSKLSAVEIEPPQILWPIFFFFFLFYRFARGSRLAIAITNSVLTFPVQFKDTALGDALFCVISELLSKQLTFHFQPPLYST